MYLSFVVYDEVVCSVDPFTGKGNMLINYNFDDDIKTNIYEGVHAYPIIYVAPSTTDELQAIVSMSDRCEQNITVPEECWNKTRWMSLNGQTWMSSMFYISFG